MDLNLEQALQRIKDLEKGIESSRKARKKIKKEAQFIDYNRLLDRFNRQKELNEKYRDALIEVTECSSIDRAEFVALNALEEKN